MGPVVASVPHHAAAVAGLAGGDRPEPHPGSRGGTDQVAGAAARPVPAAAGPIGISASSRKPGNCSNRRAGK